MSKEPVNYAGQILSVEIEHILKQMAKPPAERELSEPDFIASLTGIHAIRDMLVEFCESLRVGGANG